jgi:hypothetical protein
VAVSPRSEAEPGPAAPDDAVVVEMRHVDRKTHLHLKCHLNGFNENPPAAEIMMRLDGMAS